MYTNGKDEFLLVDFIDMIDEHMCVPLCSWHRCSWHRCPLLLQNDDLKNGIPSKRNKKSLTTQQSGMPPAGWLDNFSMLKFAFSISLNITRLVQPIPPMRSQENAWKLQIWLVSQKFWRWSGYISMPKFRPFLPCVLQNMSGSCKFGLFH